MFSIAAALFALALPARAVDCVKCHQDQTPGVVADWKVSRHAQVGVSCETCHGKEHKKATDADKAAIPTPQTCAQCHKERVDQFMAGKHAAAWAAMEAMPTIHMQPVELTEGMKGCGACHKIGAKSEADVAKIREKNADYGMASCDACHTRHTFSAAEARDPQACRTCHMGFDHPQWEMYSGSKHGVRAQLKKDGVLPDTASAPTCQTCHMPDGNHEVRTAWGFLAVRLPLPEDDPQWKADRITILQALGALDLEGNPTPLVDVIKAADVARLDQASFDAERDKMVKVCTQCHSEQYATGELAKGDGVIRQADHLMAEAIRIVADLYKDGIIETPEGHAPFPMLLEFHDANTVIEQKLFVMFLEHRMRAFQGTFHANPDYALWYGWSEMVRDLAEIRELAEQMRHNAAHAAE